MNQRDKEPPAPRRPEPPWFQAAQIGLTITGLAAGVMMFGAGMALGKSIVRGC